MTDTTEITKTEAPKQEIVIQRQESLMMAGGEQFDQLQRTARVLSESALVPQQYQGKLADCMIALDIAHRLGINYLQYMQNSYVVHGRPGIEAKLVIALINNSGQFTNRLNWEFFGTPGSKDYGCTCYTYDKATGERLESKCTMDMVHKEGWWTKYSKKTGQKEPTKWQTMTDQIFRYRTATFFGRTYCPEIIMGFQTTDELHDIVDAEFEETPQAKQLSTADQIKQRILKPAIHDDDVPAKNAPEAIDLDPPTLEPEEFAQVEASTDGSLPFESDEPEPDEVPKHGGEANFQGYTRKECPFDGRSAEGKQWLKEWDEMQGKAASIAGTESDMIDDAMGGR